MSDQLVPSPGLFPNKNLTPSPGLFPNKPKPRPAEPKPDYSGIQAYVPKSLYTNIMAQADASHGLAPHTLEAVHAVEDPSDSPNVRSSAGAVGEMQMEPKTFASMAPAGAKITDPKANINAAAAYLAHLNQQFGHNDDLVFSAYNAGPENVINKNFKLDYAKQVEANLAYLQRTIPPPKTKTPTRIASKPVREPSKPMKPSPGLFALSVNEADKAAGMAVHDPVEAAALGLGATTSDAAAAQRIANDDTQGILQALATNPEFAGTVKAANAIGAAIRFIFPDALDAAMRDMATGNTANMSLAGKAIANMIKHPSGAGAVLDAFALKYDAGSRDENVFWASQPNTIQAYEAAHPKTTLGIEYQDMIVARANMGKFLLNNNGLNDAFAVGVQLLNPAYKIPGALLTRAGKLAGPASRLIGKAADLAEARTHIPFGTVPRRLIKTVADSKAYAKAAEIYDNIATHSVGGNRFHHSGVEGRKFGNMHAEAEHANLAHKQSDAANDAALMFNQENKFNGLNRDNQLKAQMEADAISGEESAYIMQPEGGDPVFDPLTKTTVMQRGGWQGENIVDEHDAVYVQSPLSSRLTLNSHSWLTTILGPKAAQFKNLLRGGEMEDALKIAGIDEKDIRDFLRDQAFQKMQPSEKNKAITRFIIGNYARKAGKDAVNYNKDQVIFATPQKAHVRDTTMVNSTSIHDRVIYINLLKRTVDNAVRLVAPSMAHLLLPDHWARSGMFEDEVSDQDLVAGGALGAAKPGSITPGSGKRTFNSIREALEAGKKVNNNYIPFEAYQKSIKRALQFFNYVNAIEQHAKPIDYIEALKEAKRSGGYTGEVPEAEVDDDGNAVFTRKDFDRFVDSEAHNAIRLKNTQAGYDAITDPQNAENFQNLLRQEKRKIYNAVQSQWEKTHPGWIWQLDKDALVPDLAGLTVPKYVVTMAIDSHPVLAQSKIKSAQVLMHGSDDLTNPFGNAMEDLSHIMRSIYMSSRTFHGTHNLASMAFNGGLNPQEIALALLAPHKIPEADYEAAKRAGALSTGGNYGFMNPKLRARYETADIDPNLRRNPYDVSLKRKLHNVMTAYSNATEGTAGLQYIRHILGMAMFQADKWNKRATFEVFEDALSTVQYMHFKHLGMEDSEAGYETRKLMGNTDNLTTAERALGLARLEWFFTWIKTQYTYFLKHPFSGRTMRQYGAIQAGLQAQNEAEGAPNASDLTARGQAVVDIFGKHYTVSAPINPYKRFLAIQSLYSAPVTHGYSGLDFGQFVVHDVAATLNPSLQGIFEAAPAMFGQKNQSPAMMGQQVQNTLPRLLTPPNVQYAIDTAKDPRRALENILQEPVRAYQAPLSTIGPYELMQIYTKERDKISNMAGHDFDTLQRIHDTWDPIILKMQQQLKAANNEAH